MRSPTFLRHLRGVQGLALVLVACQPDIGDPCTTPSDCSLNGDRICLTDYPGGYCSVFNCEPNRCPEEAVCVAYRSTVSEADGCQVGQRLQRTFCMKECSSDSDCRKKYACVGYDADNPFTAVVVDRGKASAKICAVPYTGELIPDARPGDVCGPSEEGLPGRLDGGDAPSFFDASPVDASRTDASGGADGAPVEDAAPLPDAFQGVDATSIEAGVSVDATTPTVDAAPDLDSGAADVGPG